MLNRYLLTATLTAFAGPLSIAAQQRSVRGVVFEDANRNGRRDAGELGISRVVVSNQADVVVTDASGAFTIPAGSTGIVFVSVPDGRTSIGLLFVGGLHTPGTATHRR